QLSQSDLVRPGAGVGGSGGILFACHARAQAARWPVPADAGTHFPWLQRFGHQYLAQYHSARHLHLGRVGAAPKPGVRAGGRVVDRAVHTDVYGVVLLCVPWQGPARRGLSLMPERRPWAARIGWLLLFWAGGVAALGLAAYLVRLFMNWAGFSS